MVWCILLSTQTVIEAVAAADNIDTDGNIGRYVEEMAPPATRS